MPSDTQTKIQSLLLVAAKPLKLSEIAKTVSIDETEIRSTIEKMKQEYNQPDSGWWIIENKNTVQLVTNPDQADFIKNYLDVEEMSELTKPSLEALTIIAYCGPISKFALDKIRGVNCALILRNLMVKGLVEELDTETEQQYQVTMDFVKHLGLSDIAELPEYDSLHSHEYLTEMMSESKDDDAEDKNNEG